MLNPCWRGSSTVTYEFTQTGCDKEMLTATSTGFDVP
jgi:hypothetical protein